MSRILLDENVAIKYKNDLLDLGNDVVHINDEAKGIPDKEVFQKAIAEDRILITGDDDFKDKNFKFRIAIVWITPKARLQNDIAKKIDWIISNIEKYNIDINKAFISIRKDEFLVEYRSKDGMFAKIKEKKIEFSKMKIKDKKTKNKKK